MSFGSTRVYAPHSDADVIICNAAKRLMESIKHIEALIDDDSDYSSYSEEEEIDSPNIHIKISERHEKIVVIPQTIEYRNLISSEIEKIQKEIEILDEEFDKMPQKYGLDDI